MVRGKLHSAARGVPGRAQSSEAIMAEIAKEMRMSEHIEPQAPLTDDSGARFGLVEAARIDGGGPEAAAEVALAAWYRKHEERPGAVFVREVWAASWHGLPVVADRDVPAGVVYVGVTE